MPTYNEGKNVSAIIPEIFAAVPSSEVIVIDDNSPDGTGAVVAELMRMYPKLSLISRPNKEGLGAAYKDAFLRLRNDPTVGTVTTMDADGSHSPEIIPEMQRLALQDGYGMVIGSRYVSGGGVERWEWQRRLLSRLGNIYVGILLGTRIKDLTSGFVLFTREALAKLDLSRLDVAGYAYTIQSKYFLSHEMNISYKEIPITFHPRREGESKISSSIIKEGLLLPFKNGRMRNMKNYSRMFAFILIAIAVVAVAFRGWNMTRFDVSGDHALNSFRALGWLDFIPGEGQTGPLQWLGERPSWAAWSFQDAPPLVFAIQRASFAVFGDNTFAARFPFFLAGVLTVLAVFLLLRKYTDRATAIVGSAVLSVSSYAVWASLAGYLEGVMVLFMVLAMYFVMSWFHTDQVMESGSNVGDSPGRSARFRPYLWPVFVGLSLLSKYTALFLIPAALVSILIAWKRKMLAQGTIKMVVISAVIIIAILTPVIVYNVNVYEERGHFDSSLSSLLGISSDDFSILGDRHATLDLTGNFASIVRILASANSLPYLVLFAFALVWILIRVVRRRTSLFEDVIFVHFALMLVMFAFSGSNAVRLLSLFSVFMAIISALFAVGVYRTLVSKKLSLC